MIGEREMTRITKTQKRAFSADVMNKVWDLSNSEYKSIIRKQQAAESSQKVGALKQQRSGRWTVAREK